MTPRHSCITVILHRFPAFSLSIVSLFQQAQLVSPQSETDDPSQAIPRHCLHCPWGFEFAFCGICWFLSSEFFCLSHKKCCLDSAAIQGPVICGFLLFLLTWVAFSAILSLSQNEVETHSRPLSLALGSSPRLLSCSVKMSFLNLSPASPQASCGFSHPIVGGGGACVQTGSRSVIYLRKVTSVFTPFCLPF